MTTLSSKVSTPTGAIFVQRIHAYLRNGFENIQPHCHGNDKNSIDLKATLLAVKTNFPFGFDLHHNKFVSSINWDFKKLDLDKPISSMAVWLAFGIFVHSKTILSNVGKKKIKIDNVWTFRKSTTLPVFHSIHTLPNFTSSLLELSEEAIHQILDDAQYIIDSCCTVTYTDTPTIVEKIPHYFNFCTEITHLCLNLSSGLPLNEPVLSLRQRMLIETYTDKLYKIGRNPKGKEVSFFKTLVESLSSNGKKLTVSILNYIIRDISVVFEVCQYFDLLPEFTEVIDQSDIQILA